MTHPQVDPESGAKSAACESAQGEPGRVDPGRWDRAGQVLEKIWAVLSWVCLVVSVLALVYVLTQVPWTTTIEYSRRNGRAPLLVLLGFPLIFWWFVRAIREDAVKKKNTIESDSEKEKKKHWSLFTLILGVILLIFGTCAMGLGQLYLSYEFLREGGALG